MSADATAERARAAALPPSVRALYPFTPKGLETPAGRMAYLDEGPRDAPALLMLHGNPTWSFYYRRLALDLRETHRVIVPDHLGCGLSDKPQRWTYRLADHVANVERLVTHLGLERWSMVVHDWGGAIGFGLAGRHPARIDRLVVLNTAAFPSRRMPRAIALARLPGFGPLAIRGLNGFVRGALATSSARPGTLTAAVRAGYLAPYHDWATRIANLRFVEDIPMDPGHPSYATLEAIAAGLPGLAHKPMLIVWGGKDFVFDDHFLAEWRARFPGAEVHRVADAGHFVAEDAHDELVGWMRSFLAAASPRRGDP